MFSHEVKNYALLTYGGRLVVHGVALRSSRAEPFGDQFLRRALLCTMTDDIAGLHNIYLETIEALTSRSISPYELGARVRLSKTPETYQASRATHPEPQYEALLAAGRTRWYPGERVRFYRTRNGYVWLPEETAETATSNDWAEETQTEDDQPEKIVKPTVTQRDTLAARRDYDVEHYLQVLVTSYAARLRKAFQPEDFEQLFRREGQSGLFDRPIESIQPRWIRCSV